MKQAFILTATARGPMIVNRFDYLSDVEDPARAAGCGVEFLETGHYQQDEADLAAGILDLRRKYNGPGVIAIDGGANIGAFTVDWSKGMAYYGQIIAIEPQERIFYALAGNVTLNNCINAVCIHAAISDTNGVIDMPVPNYEAPGNFGGVSYLNAHNGSGQNIKDTAPVRCLTIDSLDLARCDFIKFDLEGMEMKALAGAEETIRACNPVLFVEHHYSGMDNIMSFIEPFDYKVFRFGMNLVCVHRLDKCLDHISQLHRALLRQNIQAEVMHLT